MEKEIEVFGEQFFDIIPLYPGVTPVKTKVKDEMINNRWKPTCSILGIDNCKKKEDNGFGVSKSMKVKISMRLPPPGINEEESINALKNTIKNNTYFSAKSNIENIDFNQGWKMTPLSERTEKILNKGSFEFFGNEIIYKGDERRIPFITYFQSKYPQTDIICTELVV